MGSGLCTACSKADTTHQQKPVWEREITTREDALKAVQVAACCYFGLSALDCIIASFGEPVLYLTAIVIAVCASLIWAYHSRVAAITLLCLFIAHIIVMAIDRFTADQRSAPYVSYALLMLQGGITIQAVKATFKLHKEYRLVPAGVMHSATFASQASVSPAVEQALPALVDASPPPLSIPTVPASPSPSTVGQGDEPAMPPPLLPKDFFVLDETRSVITPVDKLPAWFATVRKRLRRWLAARFNPHRSIDENPRSLWNPIAIIGWSLVFTPALGSALIYLNWRNLGRSKRAHTAALWFWGSVAWLLFCVLVPSAVRPPLWGYLVFVGLWIGLLGYPHHLSLARKHPASAQPTSAWAGALALAVGGGLLLWLVHAPFASLYRQKDAGVVVAPATENTAPIDPANWHPDVVPIQPLANLHQGENVVAIGNALGEGISTTSGVLSHLDPMGTNGLYFIRTSTPISPGNSRRSSFYKSGWLLRRGDYRFLFGRTRAELQRGGAGGVHPRPGQLELLR